MFTKGLLGVCLETGYFNKEIHANQLHQVVCTIFSIFSINHEPMMFSISSSWALHLLMNKKITKIILPKLED